MIFSSRILKDKVIRAGLHPDCTGKIGAYFLRCFCRWYWRVLFPCRVKCFKITSSFCAATVPMFSREYLRELIEEDLGRFENSIALVRLTDCMRWLNCAGFTWEKWQNLYKEQSLVNLIYNDLKLSENGPICKIVVIFKWYYFLPDGIYQM